MGLSPSKPPSLTENFPHNPAISEAKIWFVFRKWRGYGGSFLCLGRWRFFAVCGCRTLFVGGMRLDMIPYARAGRRNLGTRLRYHHRTLLSYRSGAKPHHIKRSHLLLQTKTSPISPPFSKSEKKSSLLKWRGYGGSSGKVREVWRVGNPLRKRVSCASKVFRSFLLSRRESFNQRAELGAVGMAVKIKAA